MKEANDVHQKSAARSPCLRVKRGDRPGVLIFSRERHTGPSELFSALWGRTGVERWLPIRVLSGPIPDASTGSTVLWQCELCSVRVEREVVI